MNVCLRIQPSERVCVITDEATVEIAASVVAELEQLAQLEQLEQLVAQLVGRPIGVARRAASCRG